MSEPEKPEQHWIVDPVNKKPIERMAHPGYYPGYSTISQKNWWDAATRSLVEKRLNEVPAIRFFNAQELPVFSATCDRILPQDDRLPEWRIPIVNYIDERLFRNENSGYQYENMPPDREAYRLGIQAIEQTSLAIHAVSFAALDSLKQDFLLKSIHDGKRLAAHEIWEKMDIHHFWALVVSDCVKAYYAHPWAWDEIGYGGPAYPRAYMRLEGGKPEPWEVDEQRYDWDAPFDSASDISKPAPPPSNASHLPKGGSA